MSRRDNILVFSTPKSIICIVLLHHRFLHLIPILMMHLSAATWQIPKFSLARTEVVTPLRRVSNIPLRTRDSRVLRHLRHFHLSSFCLLLKLTTSLLWHLSSHKSWSSRAIMLMTILTLSVESIFVFKSKRAAIVIWSPSLAARKKALSRYESRTERILTISKDSKSIKQTLTKCQENRV